MFFKARLCLRIKPRDPRDEHIVEQLVVSSHENTTDLNNDFVQMK